jgi:tetratricopeptide (TPR) repeat protein
VYLGYVNQFPKPLETVVETRFKIAELYEATDDDERHREQLQKIVSIDESAGAERSDRVRYIAAKSALTLSVQFYHRFHEVKLVQPFESNLRKKQGRMDEALKAFESLVDYEVGEATAGATFYIAELYFEFSRALLESERPTDLDPAEMLDYEMVLEEEAFPFEEQAIEVHEKNLELMSAGVYNAWIEKSLGKLADMMPGRYAKFEESSGLIASIDRYTYRVPNVPSASSEGSDGDDTTEAEDPSLQPDPAPEVESAQEAVVGHTLARGNG